MLTVTHTNGTPSDDGESPTVVSVHSGNSGREHRVDVREGCCTCRDHEHRDAVCYHIQRAHYALGVEPVDRDTLAACDVHERFAEHALGPVVVTSDGGVVGTPLESTERVDPRARRGRAMTYDCRHCAESFTSACFRNQHEIDCDPGEKTDPLDPDETDRDLIEIPLED